MGIDIGDGEIYIPPPKPKIQPTVTPTGGNTTSGTSYVPYTGGGNGGSGNGGGGDVDYIGAFNRFQLDNLLAQQTPSVDPYQAQTAEEIVEDRIEDYGAASNRQESAEDTGRLIADIAIYDTAKANEVADLYLENDAIRGKDKDELAQELVQELSDGELNTIAESEDGRELLIGMRDHLLSGSIHGDESDDASRITGALNAAQGLFTSDYDGVGAGQAGGQNPAFEDTNPTEGAHFLKFPSGLSSSGGNAQVFSQALEAHADDPEWIADFFAELGPETTARLMNDALDPSTYTPMGHEGDTDYANAQVDAVQNAFSTLQEDGVLTQETMDTLINEWDNFNPYVATEIFASANSELREMFINSVIGNGDNTFDAAALHVLGTLPYATQEHILTGLDSDQNNPVNLNAFIEGAMASGGDIATFESRVENPNGNYQMNPMVTFGGIEDLVYLATDKVGNGYPYYAESPFEERLQVNLFNAASGALDNNRTFENFEDNIRFEENLAKLFIQNRDAIFASNSSSVNGSISTAGEERLERFFQLTLMTPPQTASYDALTFSVYDYVNSTSSALQAATTPEARQAFIETYGMSPEDSAQLLGGVMGALVDSAGLAQGEINKDNAARLKQIEFFTGLAFAFVPGASDFLAEGITNEFVKHFVEQGTSYLQGEISGDFESRLNGSLASLGDDNPLEAGQLTNVLFREILGVLPNGDAVDITVEGETISVSTPNIEGQFQAGFDNVTRYTVSDANGN